MLDRAGTGTHIRCLSAALGELLGDKLVVLQLRVGRSLQKRRTLTDKTATLFRDLWWNQHGVLRAARREGVSLLHLPAAVGPVRASIPRVVTIHDLAFLRYPHFFRRWFRTYARVVVPRLARSARAVITVSEASKADVTRLLGIPEARVFVVPNGVDEGFTPVDPESERAKEVRARYNLPRAFALTVGSIEPRKNLTRLFQSLELLRTRPQTADLALVHVGPYGWLADDVERSASKLRADGTVRFLGYVPPPDLPVLYSAARLMVYPSLFEGFGLPVLEAMACGCPVVTSDVASLAEVAADAAVLADPYSVEAIADAIGRVWSEASVRSDLRERGRRRSRQYSWRRAARATVEVYDHVMSAS